jgi:hypothetical protein
LGCLGVVMKAQRFFYRPGGCVTLQDSNDNTERRGQWVTHLLAIWCLWNVWGSNFDPYTGYAATNFSWCFSVHSNTGIVSHIRLWLVTSMSSQSYAGSQLQISSVCVSSRKTSCFLTREVPVHDVTWTHHVMERLWIIIQIITGSEPG